MYLITVPTGEQGSKPLKLKTEKRNLANAMYQLGKENDLEVKVVREVESKEVKFKNA